MFGKGKQANQQVSKKKIKEFKEITGVSEQISKEILENFKTIEEAVDHYFSNQHLYAKQKAANVPKVDKASIEAVFDKFASPDDPDALYDDMLQDFVRTCGVDPTKKEALFLFYKLGASNAGELTRTEFVNGWENLGADTNQKMRAFGEKIPKEMEAESEFKEFYKWIFNYLKENKKNRTIPKQLGLAIWSILLNPAQFALLNSFKEFLANHDTEVFTRDLWEQTYEFLREVGPQLERYDPEGAWPFLIDEFVQHIKKSSS